MHHRHLHVWYELQPDGAATQADVRSGFRPASKTPALHVDRCLLSTDQTASAEAIRLQLVKSFFTPRHSTARHDAYRYSLKRTSRAADSPLQINTTSAN